MYLSGGFGYRDREGVLHAFIVTVPSVTLALHRFRSFHRRSPAMVSVSGRAEHVMSSRPARDARPHGMVWEHRRGERGG
jgi:hypothetical protein